ncbi:unnamed protein product [Rangifer tarandus platyrhynchus]|uniref:Uncharacterized protein n=2 Tax=Rangifer tarandus platyrhynchus TaxID=3082113 RepID=A0ABN8YQA0_RANTA|nr:unnamed protein product [Rangifer tarandus platyrhynchus]
MIQLKHVQPSHDGSNCKLWMILTPCAHPGDPAVCKRPCPLGEARGSFSVSLFVVGRIMPPAKDVHILTPRIYRYITRKGVLRIPWWLRCKECLQCGRPGFDLAVRKIPWRRRRQPTPVFLPGKSHGWRSLAGYSPWGLKESDTTELLYFHKGILR